MAEAIHVKYKLTATRLYINAEYRGVQMNVSWALEDKDYMRHLNTIVLNMPEMVADGAQEVIVRRESDGLDAEIRHLFSQEEQ